LLFGLRETSAPLNCLGQLKGIPPRYPTSLPRLPVGQAARAIRLSKIIISVHPFPQTSKKAGPSKGPLFPARFNASLIIGIDGHD
jgi:hypothetical protein